MPGQTAVDSSINLTQSMDCMVLFELQLAWPAMWRRRMWSEVGGIAASSASLLFYLSFVYSEFYSSILYVYE
jgi:hypothetical protein